MRPLLTLLFFFLLGIAHAGPELVGVLTNGPADLRFILSVSPGAASKWVVIGDTIDGYTVAEYRATDDILVLKKDGQPLFLKLKTAKVARDGYRGAPLTYAAAKQLVASREEWNTGVIYSLSHDKMGDWSLVAMKRDANGLMYRFLPVTEDSIPAAEKEQHLQEKRGRGR